MKRFFFITIIVLFLFSCGLIAPNPLYRNKIPKYYYVKKGDTLNKISAQFDIPVSKIKEYNNLKTDTIFIGQKLYFTKATNRFNYYVTKKKIPEKGYHIVKKGETLPIIAIKYDIPLQELMDYNNLSSFKVEEGKKIFLKKNKIATPPKKKSPPMRAKNSVTHSKKHPRKVKRKKIPRSENYVIPLKGIVTSEFGLRHGRPHKGIDIAAPMGTPIKSIADGKVVFSGVQNGYGNVIIIEHNDNVMSVYAHCERNLVRENDTVKKGQPIATVGKTGRATGPHLHFEFRVNGRAINPRKIFNF